MDSSKKSIAKLTILKIVGAVLGVGYSILQVQYFGVSRDIEIYFVASSVLYLITSLAQSGQLSELFLPIYHQQVRKEGKLGADQCFSVILNRLFLYSLLISIVAILIAPIVIELMIPGFSREDQIMAISIFRIMALFLIFTMNSGFIQTYLNANKIYGRAEIAGLISTTASIILLILLFNTYGVWSLVFSFVVGRLMEFVVYIITLKYSKFEYVFMFSKEGFNHTSFFKSMYSTAGYSGATQLYNVVLTASISFLPQGIFAIFKYTQQLMTKASGVFFQPLLTLFYTSFSKSSEQNENQANSMIKKYMSIVIIINVIVLINIVSFGETILKILWGSENFNIDHIYLASLFLIFNFIASAIAQIGGVFRKVAMSYGYGKKIYVYLTVSQLVATISSYLLIMYFGTEGLLLVVPINGLLFYLVSYGIVRLNKKALTRVFDTNNLVKLTILALFIIPLGNYLNQMSWDWMLDGSRMGLILQLGLKVFLISLVIAFVSFLLKIREIIYIKDVFKKIIG